MNAPANFPTKGITLERFLSKARHTSAALRRAAEQGVPSAYRAVKIANVIDEYLARDASEMRALSRPEQSMLGMYLTDYKHAIAGILAEDSEDYFTTPMVTSGMGAG